MRITPNEWAQFRNRQRQRQIAQEAAVPGLYAPLKSKSEDAIEAELAAATEAEQRMIGRMNCAISEIFAEASSAMRGESFIEMERRTR